MAGCAVMSPTRAGRWWAVARRRNVVPTLVTVLVAAPLVTAVVTGRATRSTGSRRPAGAPGWRLASAGTVTLIDGPSEEVVDTLRRRRARPPATCSSSCSAGRRPYVVQPDPRDPGARRRCDVRRRHPGPRRRPRGTRHGAAGRRPGVRRGPGAPHDAVLDADALTLQRDDLAGQHARAGAVRRRRRRAAVGRGQRGQRPGVVPRGRPGGAGARRRPAQVVLVRGRAVLADLGARAARRAGCRRPRGRLVLPRRPAPGRPCSCSARGPRTRSTPPSRRPATSSSRRSVGRLPGRRPGRRRGRSRLRPHGAERPVRLRAGPHHRPHDDHRHRRRPRRRHVRAHAPGHRLELASKDGIVFFNDLDGETAGVLTLRRARPGARAPRCRSTTRHRPPPSRSSLRRTRAPHPPNRSRSPPRRRRHPRPSTRTDSTAPSTAPSASAPPAVASPRPTAPAAAVPAPRTGTDHADPRGDAVRRPRGAAGGDVAHRDTRRRSSPASRPRSQRPSPARSPPGAGASPRAGAPSWPPRRAPGSTSTSRSPTDGDPNVVVTLTVSGPGGSSAPAQLALTVAGPPVATLTVTVTGGGTVDVDGAPCSDVCAVELTPGTTAGLTVPSRQFPAVFDGWGGACCGTGGVRRRRLGGHRGHRRRSTRRRSNPRTAWPQPSRLTIVPDGGRWLLTDGVLGMVHARLGGGREQRAARSRSIHDAVLHRAPDRRDGVLERARPRAPRPSAGRLHPVRQHEPRHPVRAPAAGSSSRGRCCMATFETEADAGRGLVVAQASGRQCFVGRVSPPGETAYFLP